MKKSKGLNPKHICTYDKIINNFMDIKPYIPYGQLVESYNIFPGIYKLGQMKYHSSWTWLMPVVEKIVTMKYVIKVTMSPTISEKWISKEISISKNTVEGLKTPIINIRNDYTNNESFISIYYKAVLAFIKWYNNREKE